MPRSDSYQLSELEEQLVQIHYGLVVSQALRFSSRHGDLDDYIQVGSIGLLKAIRNYDPDKKNKFSTFATVCIKNEILRYIRQQKKKTTNHPQARPVSTKQKDWYMDKEKLWEFLPDCLTESDREILYMRCENYTYKEIANYLSRPVNQIKNDVQKMITKIQKANRHEPKKKNTSL